MQKYKVKPGDVKVQVWLPYELVNSIDELSNNLIGGANRSDFIRRAIQHYKESLELESEGVDI